MERQQCTGPEEQKSFDEAGAVTRMRYLQNDEVSEHSKS
jgi:hypothetical protein